jgi:rod shape-determining protein MreD
MKKILLLIVSFYFLAALQTSFLAHFNLFGFYPNFILLAVIFINFFEKNDHSLGLVAGIWGGLLLDVFSVSFFGFHVLICLAFSLAIKLIIRKYVWTPAIWEF